MALLLCLGIFLFWFVCGWVVTSQLNRHDEPGKNILLAPVAGAAVTLLPLLWLSRFGVPVRISGPLLSIAYAVAAGVFLRVPALILRWKDVRPFAIILGIALFASGYPMLLHGFNWVSYSNDDMANYVLSAHLFLNHGFFDLPGATQLLENRDASLNLWFLYALAGVRPGSELLLSWIISNTGLTGHQIYMPVILALHLVLISTTGALVYRAPKYRTAAICTCALLSVSALNTLGTMYQLIAQVFGLSLLAGTCALLLRYVPKERRRSLREIALIGILCAATGVVYPEITPFVFLSFALYHLIALIQKREGLWSLVKWTVPIGASTAVFLNTFIPSTISFLASQAGRSFVPLDLKYSLFPYYLIPTGLANLWGIIPISDVVRGPIANMSIVLGAVLCALAFVAVIWQMWKGQPASFICLIMMALGIQLFVNRNDFGLFKLAMYIQPFLLSSIALAWLQFADTWLHESH